MRLLKKKDRKLNSRTPAWFKEWDRVYFRPVEGRSSRNEKLIYVILIAVLGLNTAGNWYHTEIMDFIVQLLGG